MNARWGKLTGNLFQHFLSMMNLRHATLSVLGIILHHETGKWVRKVLKEVVRYSLQLKIYLGHPP